MEVWRRVCIFISVLSAVHVISSEIPRDNVHRESTTTKLSELDTNSSLEVEDKLAQQIYQLIEHYKQDDPIGLPIVPLPDPTDVDDQRQSFTAANMHMTSVKLHGTSQFRIKYITTDIKGMKATCGIHFDLLKVTGNYVLSSFMTKSKGPFEIRLTEVVIDGIATIGVERDGKLRAQDVVIDIKFGDLKMDFQNLGFLSSVFKSIALSASHSIFENMKPYILKDAYVKIKAAMDESLGNIVGPNQIPNSIAPIDNAIAEARKQVRERGYDPFKVDDYNYPGVFGVKIFGTWLYGISSFYRLGEMSIVMRNNTVVVTMEIGTQEITGHTNWQVSIAKGMITRTGSLHFTVQHLKVLFTVTQPLNLSKKLQINDLQLNLGNIQIRSSGLGTADYLVEFFINVMPNLLRYQIMDALEKPLMAKIQQYADKIDVEQLVKEKLDEYQKTGTVSLNLKMEL